MNLLSRPILRVILAWLALGNRGDAAPAASAADPVFGADTIGVPHVYKQVGDRALRLHILHPVDWRPTDRRPAVVFFHGGSWTTGRPVQFNDHVRYIATRGVVCVQAEYRLLDEKTNEPPLVCIQDAKTAMRWLRAHAGELGIDSSRIAAAGGSAGGHLAAFVGMVDGLDDSADDLSVSAKADALVLFNPVFDNGPDDGYGTARIGDRFKEYSPAHNITADDPPTLVFLGARDRLIPTSVVERFQAGMARVGVRCESVIYQGQGHGFFNLARGGAKYHYETLRVTDVFLASLGWLQGPPTLPRPPSDGTSWPEGSATVPLFNGRDFSGLHVFVENSATTANAAWKIEHGVLRCTGAGRGYVRTVLAYADYKLRLEWRWPAGRGNSGVMLNIVNDDVIWPKCIEAQLATDHAGDFATFSDARSNEELVSRNPRGVGTGRLARPGPSVENPIGEWNTFEITVTGGTIALAVNGREVNRMTGVLPSAGMIGFQAEGTPIDFRAITLTRLPPAKDLHAPMPP